jgi:hypothetical protein
LTHLGGRVLEVRSGVGGAQGSAARCSGDMTGGRRRVACEQGRGESGCRMDPDVGLGLTSEPAGSGELGLTHGPGIGRRRLVNRWAQVDLNLEVSIQIWTEIVLCQRLSS